MICCMLYDLKECMYVIKVENYKGFSPDSRKFKHLTILVETKVLY